MFKNKQKKPKTWVYIDSFNLYYGILKGKDSGLKWLNLESWLLKLLPNYDIQKIKFFTAKSKNQSDDLQKSVRQDMYFRALKTLPKIEFVYGRYKLKTIKINISKGLSFLVKRFEEKETDVNIGSHLVNDAHKKEFDVAVIVSNDSDLSGALRIIRNDLPDISIGIINPSYNRFSKQLSKYSNFKYSVRKGPIKDSQFSNKLSDSLGNFNKPPSW